MAVARLHFSLKRVLCNPSVRALAVQSRCIGSTTPCFDEENDAGEGLGQEQKDEMDFDSSSSLLDTEKGKEPVKAPPYTEELRKVMVAKYLSNQPIARAHPLCESSSSELSLQELRKQYKQKVAAVRKKYIMELERERAAKASQDKKQREEILRAKEERLRLKREKSAQRAIEVAEERRILQEQLAKERAVKRAYRKIIDLQVEERRQRERDIVRQESGNWIEEKDLEMRIVEAYMNPIDL